MRRIGQVRSVPELFFSNGAPGIDMMYQNNVTIGDIAVHGQPDIVFDSCNSGIVLERQDNY